MVLGPFRSKFNFCCSMLGFIDLAVYYILQEIVTLYPRICKVVATLQTREGHVMTVIVDAVILHNHFFNGLGF